MTIAALYLSLALHGCSPACAAGIAGNLYVESRLEPCLSSASGIGMPQFAGPRRKRFLAWAGRRWCDAGLQLAFMMQELAEFGLKERLFAMRDPGAAAALFAREYEKGAGTGFRVAAARRFYNEIILNQGE